MVHMTVLSPEAVAFDVEGIAACIGPSTVELTLPLNAAKCLELSQLTLVKVSITLMPPTIVCIRTLCRGRIGSCKRTDIIYDIISYIISKKL